MQKVARAIFIDRFFARALQFDFHCFFVIDICVRFIINYLYEHMAAVLLLRKIYSILSFTFKMYEKDSYYQIQKKYIV